MCTRPRSTPRPVRDGVEDDDRDAGQRYSEQKQTGDCIVVRCRHQALQPMPAEQQPGAYRRARSVTQSTERICDRSQIHRPHGPVELNEALLERQDQPESGDQLDTRLSDRQLLQHALNASASLRRTAPSTKASCGDRAATARPDRFQPVSHPPTVRRGIAGPHLAPGRLAGRPWSSDGVVCGAGSDPDLGCAGLAARNLTLSDSR